MLKTRNNNIFIKAISLLVMVFFSATMILPQEALAQTLTPTSSIVPLSPAFTPAIVRGIRVYPENPLKFDFIIDPGDANLSQKDLKKESEKLIRYFLASLTVPENNLWVNLSPYEKDRIIPDTLGNTELGHDMLSQDYLLKQITASLTNPDSDLGKEFWQKIYKKAYEEYGTTNIPVDTFNKVWIMPSKAEVYENGDKAFVVESKLKVMLEEDYIALANGEAMLRDSSRSVALQESQKSKIKSQSETQPLHTTSDIPHPKNALASSIVREVFIPALEKEVNEGKNFAQLRQIYNAIILSYWYKTKLKESILNKVYADKGKVKGIDLSSKAETDKVYSQYLDTFKKGICNMMKVEYDPYVKKVIPRKYFAGGVTTVDIKGVFKSTENPSARSALVQTFKKAMTAIMLVGVMLTTSSLAMAQNAGRSDTRNDTYSFYKGKSQSEPLAAFRDLSLYKNEAWAPEILKAAAEGMVKKDPMVVVLHSSSYEGQPWASQILEEAVNNIIEGRTPFRAATYFSKYEKYPWALAAMQRGVKEAANKTPESLVLGFYEIEKYDWALFYVKEALNNLLNKDPEKVFNNAFMFEDQIWFSEILKKAVEAVEKKDPQSVLNFFEGYQKELWAKDVVGRIAKRSPQIALMYADRYQSMSWAADIIWSSAERDPWSAYAYEKNFSLIKDPSFRKNIDSLKENIRNTIKKMPSDTFPSNDVFQKAKTIYEQAKQDPASIYWAYKKKVAKNFKNINPIGLVGFLNTAYINDLLTVSDMTGVDPEFIMAVYAQEGSALLHKMEEYDPQRIVDAYDGVGMDNMYALLPDLLKNGLSVEYEKILNYRKNESGMILRPVSIKEKEALKAIAGVLQILQRQLKTDVTQRWGSGAWSSMTRQARNFWTYVYYNAGVGKGRELLDVKGAGSLRNGWKDYDQVYTNAARTAGGAELLRELNLFPKAGDRQGQRSSKTQNSSAQNSSMIDPFFDPSDASPIGNKGARQGSEFSDAIAWIGIGDTAYVLPSSAASSSAVQVQRVKEVNPSDVRQILDLDRSFFPRNYQMKKENVENYLSDPSAWVLVAKEDGKIVGFSIYYAQKVYDAESPYFHLARIVTSKDKRGEGIGTQLMDRMIEDIKSQGKDEFSYVPFNGASLEWFKNYSVKKGFVNQTIGSLGEKMDLANKQSVSSSLPTNEQLQQYLQELKDQKFLEKSQEFLSRLEALDPRKTEKWDPKEFTALANDIFTFTRQIRAACSGDLKEFLYNTLDIGGPFAETLDVVNPLTGVYMTLQDPDKDFISENFDSSNGSLMDSLRKVYNVFEALADGSYTVDDVKLWSQKNGFYLDVFHQAEETPAPSEGGAENNENLGRDNLGGIDFNAEGMNMKTKGQGVDFNVPSGASLESLMGAEGFIPTIMNMTPIVDVMGLLGLKEKELINDQGKESRQIEKPLALLAGERHG